MVAFGAIKMSCILNYFTWADKGTSSNVIIPVGGVPGILDRKILNINDKIQSTSGVKGKRVTYGELDQMKIRKHANECGIANVAVKYKGKFPSFTESTVSGWLKNIVPSMR